MPQKRKVSAATLARLKELRRKHGLGEFKTEGSPASRRSGSPKRRRRSSGSELRRPALSRQVFGVYRPFTGGTYINSPVGGSAPLRSGAVANITDPNPRSPGPLRPISPT